MLNLKYTLVNWVFWLFSCNGSIRCGPGYCSLTKFGSELLRFVVTPSGLMYHSVIEQLELAGADHI